MKCFVAIQHFTAFCLAKARLDFGGDIGAIFSQPLFVFMEHLNRLGNEIIGGRVGTGFHVFLDKRFQLRF